MSVKILQVFMVPFFATLMCSCEKAPETGEAFVTLQSDEIRYLGDLEVSFYDSDFSRKLEEFQRSIFSDTKIKAAAPYKKEVEIITVAIKSQEALNENVDEASSKIAENETAKAKNARAKKLSDRERKLQSDLASADQHLDALMKKLAEEKQTLITRQNNLKRYLTDTKLKYDSLLSILSPHLKKEKELIEKGYSLGNIFYADITKLTTKINETIVAEKIPIKQLIDPALACKNSMISVKARSATEVLSYKYGDSPNAIGFGVRDSEYGGTVIPGMFFGELVPIKSEETYRNVIGNNVFTVKSWSQYGIEEGIYITNYPPIEKSAVAKNIIFMFNQQKSFCSEIIKINKDLKSNDKSLHDKFRIWMNENDMDSDDANSLLLTYEENLKYFEAAPEQIKAVEKKQDEAPEQAATSRTSIETIGKEEIEKIKEEIASFEQNIADYKKNCNEIAKKQMLKEVASKLSELNADLQEAKTTIEKINNSASISKLCAVDGVGHKIIDANATIAKISNFLNEAKISSTRTGSDGKFKVPDKARYSMAYHYRESTKNELFWLIKINLDEDQVRLTNSNITNTHLREGPDSAWDFLRSDIGKSLLEVLEVNFVDD